MVSGVADSGASSERLRSKSTPDRSATSSSKSREAAAECERGQGGLRRVSMAKIWCYRSEMWPKYGQISLNFSQSFVPLIVLLVKQRAEVHSKGLPKPRPCQAILG